MKFGEILLHENIIDRKTLEEALSYQKDQPLRIGEVLCWLGFIDETTINKVLAIQQSIMLFPLEKLDKQSLERYKFIEILGEGGMGQVYKVYDKKLGREVALKIMKNFKNNDLQRLVREAKIMARLNHPNLITMYEVNEISLPYFTMEYIEGETLSQRAKKDFHFTEMAKIIIKIAQGLHVAHQQGIIHRDIKPSNIMITSSGIPILMDFGLAKWIDLVPEQSREQDLSRTGDIIGTPAYMSPEQINGGKITYQTDVYSLGATLYYLLAKRPPFEGSFDYTIFMQVLEAEPIKLRKLRPDIPLDLEKICLGCLEKKPDQRNFKTTLELAEDLNNYLTNMPLKYAKDHGKITHLKKFYFRHMIIINFIFAFIFSLVIGVSYYISSIQKEQQKTLEALNDSTQNLGEVLLEKAKDFVDDKNWFSAKMAASKAITEISKISSPSDNLISQKAQEIIDTNPNIRPLWLNTHFHHFGSIRTLAIHTQEKIIASGGDDGLIKIWDIATGDQIGNNFVGHNKSILDIVFFPEKNWLISASADATIKIWDVKKNCLLTTLAGHRTNVCCLSILGQILLSGDAEGIIIGWDLNNLEKLHEWHEHKDKVNSIASLQENQFFSGSEDGTIRLWDITQKKSQQILTQSPIITYGVKSLHTAPAKQQLFSASGDGTISIYELDSHKNNTASLIDHWHAHDEAIHCLRLHHHFIVSIGDDGKTCAWQINTKEKIWQIDSPFHPFYDLELESQTLICSGNTGTIEIFDWQELCTRKQKTYTAKNIIDACFSQDGKMFACIANEQLEIWSVKDFRKIVDITCGSMNQIQFSPDNKHIVTSKENIVKIWDYSGTEIIDSLALKNLTAAVDNHSYFGNQEQQEHIPTSEKIEKTIITSDNATLIAATTTGLIQLWDIKEKKLLQETMAHRGRITDIAIDHTGKFLASACIDGTFKIWSLRSSVLDPFALEQINTVKSFFGRINALDFAPDGKSLLVASNWGTISIWETNISHELATIPAQTELMTGMALSMDGRSLIWSGYHGEIGKLNLANNTVDLQKMKRPPRSFTLLKDGRTMLCANQSQTVLSVHDLVTQSEIKGYQLPEKSFVNVTISPNNQRVTARCNDGCIYLWDLMKNNILNIDSPTHKIFTNMPLASNIIFIDNNKIAYATNDIDIAIWDIQENREIIRFQSHAAIITQMAYRANQKLLVSCSHDGNVNVWDITKNICIRTFSGKEKVMSVTWIDDNTIASGQIDGTIKVWCLYQPQALTTFSGHHRRVMFLQYSPETKLLFSGSKREIKIWRIEKENFDYNKNYKGFCKAFHFHSDSFTQNSFKEKQAILFPLSSTIHVGVLQKKQKQKLYHHYLYHQNYKSASLVEEK